MSLADIGRRAVACKHWRWMPGMYLLPHLDGCECCEDRNFPRRAARLPAVFTTDVDVPDLSDPATLGCLLHLVQEAWNACRISVCFSAYMPDATKRWSVPISFFKDQRDLVHVPSFYGETQAEALVAALEAAP